MPTPKLEQAANGYYYIKWTDGRRSKRVSTRTRDVAAAKVFFGQWLRLESLPQVNVKLTCGEVWELYSTNHVRKKGDLPGSQENAEFCWRNLRELFADRPVAAVTQATINDYVAARTAGRIGRKAVHSTIRHELVLLRAAINWCVKRKIVPADDAPFFELPPDAEPRDRWLTEDEVARLLDGARQQREATKSDKLSRLEIFLALALNTGSRKTAILRLTWDRVDLDAQVIHFAIPGRRKTKKRAGSVPINSTLLPVLQRAYAERRNNLVVMHSADINKPIDRLAAHVGIEGVTPHVFRHTFATHLARKGVSLWTIAKLLCVTLAIAERTYAKHTPDFLREGIEAAQFGAHLSDLGVVCSPQRPAENRQNTDLMAIFR